MPSSKPSVTTYIIVLVALLVLTFLTVGVSFGNLSPDAHLATGMSIAVLKAALVVLFFMHAVSSPRVTWCVIVASIGWIFILFSLTISDFATRSMMTGAPGH